MVTTGAATIDRRLGCWAGMRRSVPSAPRRFQSNVKELEMNKIALIIAAAGMAGFTGAAIAQDASSAPNGGGAPSFDMADSNHDGFVDFSEAQAAYPGLDQNNFDQVDTNKDGKLTLGEYGQLGGEQYSGTNSSKSSK
jgi:EF hand